ncbi:DMT family transporter [Flammeovirgaceae bacterium SG7u.111]|nr:DMT family transporter [Flammeovirgaceae bacterium SG7u.132]WPO33684.1 DMT family transporter [Flammeovirgaceae bacterium SG7u.111]
MIFTKGVWYMFGAVFFFSCMGLLVKLAQHIPAVEVVFFRSLISLVMSVTMLKVQKVSIWGNNKKYLILRGVAGAIALILYFITLQAIPLASAVMLGFIAPVFATLLGVFIVKEKVYKLQWVFFLLAFVGIFLVEGFDPRVKWIYILFGLIASFSSGLAHNFIRKLKTSEHPLVIIFYFPLITLPLTGLYCLFFEWKTPMGWDWLLLLGIGLLTQIAQYLMTKSLQIEALSKVVIIRYTSIVFALSFGYIFFEETYGWVAYIGMMLSILGVALNLWYRQFRLNKVSKTSLAG